MALVNPFSLMHLSAFTMENNLTGREIERDLRRRNGQFLEFHIFYRGIGS
jgi:hypothetical protein